MFAKILHRPALAIVISIIIVFLGGLGYVSLPRSQFPNIAPPTVLVFITYPGASAEVLVDSTLIPLERSINGVAGMRYMSSDATSAGEATIRIYFEPGTDPDLAVVNVQNRISVVKNLLPPLVQREGIIVNQVMPSMLMYVNVYSTNPKHDQKFLFNFTNNAILQEIRRINGIGSATILGSRTYAMRIWLNPQALQQRKLSTDDVMKAIAEQSVIGSPGRLGQATGIQSQSKEYVLTYAGRYNTVEQYRNIILKVTAEGEIVRLSDVCGIKKVENGEVVEDPVGIELGSEFFDIYSDINDHPSAAIVLKQNPGSNAVAVIEKVKEKLEEIKKERFEPNMDFEVSYDVSKFLEASIEKVMHTLFEAFVLVSLVVFLFLGDLRSTLIPILAVPVSLIGTFFIMQLLGLSINLITLFAMVLAIGVVVDDAIVVVENIHRHLEAGLDKREAAIKGAGEIGFTVVSISFSLVAAFIPLLFMGGVVGRLFKEFALTATSTILISVVVSLTLAPTLAALFMRAPTHHAHDKPGFSERLLAGYARNLRRALAHQRSMAAIFVVTLALAVVGYVFIPKGFFPVQDTGFVLGTSEAAADVSYPDMVAKHKALAEIVKADPAVEAFSHSVGVTGSNQTIANGRFWIALKDRGDRDVSASQFIDRIRPKLAKVPGIVLYLRAGQDINLSSGPSRAQYQYVLKSNDGPTLNTWTQRLTEKLRANPAFRDLSNDLQLGGSITHISIDRQAAARFGLTATDVDQALYDAFGQRQINEFQTEINQYQVVLELDTQQRGKAESLNYFYLRSPLTNEMVPLSALAKVDPPTVGPLSISHDGMFPAANLSFNLAPGVALGDAVIMLNQAKNEIGMPTTIIGNFQGAAQAFQSSLASQPWLILAALVAVYIILGVLYESFVHPLTIISTLPSAGLGALIMLSLMGQDFSIMALIGLVLLIGIVKKNGILMIDFALEAQRVRGLSPEDAIYEACVTRFRPIIMTTLAALLGAVPLMLGAGPGAEMRQPLGIAVVGGLLVSQALTLFTTPVIYLYLEKFFHRPKPTPALATTD